MKMKSGKLTLDSYYLLYVLPVSSVPSRPKSHQFPPGVLCLLLGLQPLLSVLREETWELSAAKSRSSLPSAESTLSWACKGPATGHLPPASTSPTAHLLQTHSAFQTHQAALLTTPEFSISFLSFPSPPFLFLDASFQAERAPPGKPAPPGLRGAEMLPSLPPGHLHFLFITSYT